MYTHIISFFIHLFVVFIKLLVVNVYHKGSISKVVNNGCCAEDFLQGLLCGNILDIGPLTFQTTANKDFT